ncbi:MAG: Hsp33 family molecular chaperone HslO [Spirochaetia bacterium]|nr:Hsp33 family molecular chaperone HslO [Spirochaetia bacterium]
MIQKLLTEDVESYLNTLQPDSIETFLLKNGTVRGSLLHGTRMIHAMQANHETGILETYILGHAYIAAGLLTSMLKGTDKIGLTVECAGPAKGFDVEASARGDVRVRGYLRQNPIPIEKPLESFDMSPFFGPGFLTLTRTLEGARQPVTGQTMMRHGSIAKDLANHFLESEQTPTLFFLSIQFDKRGNIAGAGGLFLQVMPGADDQILHNIESAACSMPSMGQWFAESGSTGDLIKSVFSDFSPKIIGTRDVNFFCYCERFRFLNFIASLTGETRKSVLEEGPFPLLTTCRNCSTIYSFSKEEIHSVLTNSNTAVE